MNPHTVAAILMALLVITDAFSGNHIHIFAIYVSTSVLTTLVSASAALHGTSTNPALQVGKWVPRDARPLLFLCFFGLDVVTIAVLFVAPTWLTNVKTTVVGQHLIWEAKVLAIVNTVGDFIALSLVLMSVNRGTDLVGVVQCLYLNMVISRWSCGHFGLAFWKRQFWSLDDFLSFVFYSGSYIVGSSVFFNNLGNGDDSGTESTAITVVRFVTAVLSGLSYIQTVLKDLTPWGRTLIVRVVCFWFRKPSFTGSPALQLFMRYLMLSFFALMSAIYFVCVGVVCATIGYTCEPDLATPLALFPFQMPGVPAETICTDKAAEDPSLKITADKMLEIHLKFSMCGLVQRAFPLCAIVYMFALEKECFAGYNDAQNNAEEVRELEDLGNNDTNQANRDEARQ